MTGPVAGIRRRRTVAGRRETTHLPPDRDFYGQTLYKCGGKGVFAFHSEVCHKMPRRAGIWYNSRKIEGAIWKRN